MGATPGVETGRYKNEEYFELPVLGGQEAIVIEPTTARVR
jgi:hypothetical protein